MLVELLFIGAALLVISGLVALEVALLESRRSFLPQSPSADNGQEGEKGDVSVSEFIVASRIASALLLLAVGGVGYSSLRLSPTAQQLSIESLGAASWLVTALSSLAIAAVVLLVGFIIPAYVGSRFRDSVITFAAPLGRGVVIFAWPALLLARLMRKIGAPKQLDAAVEEEALEEALEEDIRSLVEEGERAGVIEEEEREMISGVFRLGDKQVASLMTSRSDVVFLKSSMTAEQALEVVLKSRFTWYPVRNGGDDEVVGIVSVHDIIGLQRESSETKREISTLAQQAIDVPESMTALELLELFREQSTHFAVVRDEYGSVAGIATVDDVLRVIVGEVGDGVGEERSIVTREDGSLLVDASSDVQNLFEKLEIEDDSEDDGQHFHSVGGFVMNSLGHIPKEGDAFIYQGFRFEVVDMDGKRIDKVLVMRVAARSVVGG
ncbi:MAG: hemolysin family protein [Pseudomonadota bacterium]